MSIALFRSTASTTSSSIEPTSFDLEFIDDEPVRSGGGESILLRDSQGALVGIRCDRGGRGGDLGMDLGSEGGEDEADLQVAEDGLQGEGDPLRGGDRAHPGGIGAWLADTVLGRSA